MDKPSRLKIDLSSINGPYQLIGLSLLVVEGLLGYWLFRAESPLERGFTGLVMLLIFFGLIYAVIQIRKISHSEPQSLVKPPEGEATAIEIATPTQESIPAPDRSYLIDLPPNDWTVRELSSAEWIAEGMGIKDLAAKEELLGSAEQRRDILVFEDRKHASIIPIPGQTLIDGRRSPSALEISAPTQLAILPIERAQPPLFVERPLEHNFLTLVGQITSAGLLHARQLEKGVIAKTGRRFMAVDLRQEIKNAIVNGKENQDVVITISVVGIEGELGDHLLIMKGYSIPGDRDTKENLRTLQGLITSFRPLKIVNAEEKKREISALADEKFNELVAENGEDLFYTELYIVLLRVKNVNLDDPEKRIHAIRLLKPFEIFAQEIKLQDEFLEQMWEALPRAEAGDAVDFKKLVAEMLEDMEEEEQELLEEAPLLPEAEKEPEEANAPAQ